MPTKEIVLYPEDADILRRKSAPVARMTNRLKRLIEDLKDTLHAHPEGVGLAAPQIGAHRRVVVVRLGSGADAETEPGPPIALINPEIVEVRDRKRDFDGCLSLPGLYGETTRPHHLRVTGLDEEGRPFDRIFEGFDAVVVHHEIDHLDGVLFIDRAESLEDLYRVRETEDGELVHVPLAKRSKEPNQTKLSLGLVER
ncbi:MAG: peptide deformylase [Chloroflexota bacterium]